MKCPQDYPFPVCRWSIRFELHDLLLVSNGQLWSPLGLSRVGNQNQPATAEMLYGASGKLVGIGSSLPEANALARTYIWLDVAPAASIAFATMSQLRTSVDI